MTTTNGTNKLIINAAITGCVYSRADSPHLPLSIGEIVHCVRQVRDEGAAIVHLHARDEEGRPTGDADSYARLVAAVRSACPDIIVCVSTSGRHGGDVEARSAALQSRPDMASLTMGSANFPRQVNANHPDVIEGLATRMISLGIAPEMEVFEAGFINYANYLLRKKVIAGPLYFNLMMGCLGGAPLDLVGLGHMVSLLPPGSQWGAAGLGRYQLDATLMAIAAGGHVRVGLEDNLYFDRARTELADNARLVARVASISRQVGREVASADEARAIIGLREKPLCNP